MGEPKVLINPHVRDAGRSLLWVDEPRAETEETTGDILANISNVLLLLRHSWLPLVFNSFGDLRCNLSEFRMKLNMKVRILTRFLPVLGVIFWVVTHSFGFFPPNSFARVRLGSWNRL